MIETLLACVETRMIDVLAPLQHRENLVCRGALHHLAAGGSRLRASLCLDCSMKLGIGSEDAITLASTCELLHNASLVHDDLLDRAPTRRQSPSVWSAFGDAAAVCSGDLLLAGAFALVGELHSIEFVAPVLGLVHQRTREVILGQGAEQACPPSSLQSYQLLAVGKSASLLSLPFELPLLLSGNKGSIVIAQRAAGAFAAAYQMLDDLADYDEDVRNGSLNAVSVALAAGSPDDQLARILVCSYAAKLIRSSIAEAVCLPRGCGAAMIAHSEKMLLALAVQQESVGYPIEQLRYGG